MITLTGCQPAAVFTPVPPNAVPPVFSSEEEALAAAEETWIAYIAASNQMGASRGADLSGFEGIVSEEQLADEREAAAEIRDTGKYSTGALDYFGFRRQQYHEDGAPGAYLQAYVCADLANIEYYSADGTLLNVEGRALWIPYEVVFVTDGPKPPFVIREVIRWTGRDFCSYY